MISYKIKIPDKDYINQIKARADVSGFRAFIEDDVLYLNDQDDNLLQIIS